MTEELVETALSYEACWRKASLLLLVPVRTMYFMSYVVSYVTTGVVVIGLPSASH